MNVTSQTWVDWVPYSDIKEITAMLDSVLIVGAGPVGLIVATQLKHYGINVDIIDSRVDRDLKSKALSVSAATLKTLAGIGVDLETSPKAARVHDISVLYNNRRIAHINKRYIPSRFDFYLSIPQPETERLLESRLANLNVSVRRGQSLVNLIPHDKGVDAAIHDQRTGVSTIKSYAAVVGCDGSQSTVRQLREIEFSGVDYNAHMVLADVRFKTSSQQQHESSYHVTENGFLVFLPMGDGVTRLVVGKAGLRSREMVPPDIMEFQKYLDRYYNQHLAIKEMIWSSSVRMFSRLATKLRDDLIFLAGDSTHVFSPIGGQGLNTGAQDAFNLSWKLALTLTGVAKPALLDTYERERRLAIDKVAAMTHSDTIQIFRLDGSQETNPLYVPSMASRALYRSDLALRFSGFSVDHNENKASIVGKHVPDISLNDPILATTYDVPNIKRNLLLSSECINDLDTSFLRNFCHVVVQLSARHLMAQDRKILQIDSHPFCLIRPDGYIGFQGTAPELNTYLAAHYYTS